MKAVSLLLVLGSVVTKNEAKGVISGGIHQIEVEGSDKPCCTFCFNHKAEWGTHNHMFMPFAITEMKTNITIGLQICKHESPGGKLSFFYMESYPTEDGLGEHSDGVEVDPFIEWTYICFTLDVANRKVHMAINGQVQNNWLEDHSVKGNWPADPTFYVLLKPAYTSSTPFGKEWFSNFAIFAVPSGGLETLNCSQSGDIYAWDPTDWSSDELDSETEICPTKRMQVLTSIQNSYLPFTKTKTLCTNLGGQLPTITTGAKMAAFINETVSDPSVLMLWTGFVLDAATGQYRNAYTQEAVTLSPPAKPLPGFPPNSEYIVFFLKSQIYGKVTDDFFSASLVCEADRLRFTRLRGICRKTTLDKSYFPRQENGVFFYKGLEKTKIYLDKERGIWNISNGGKEVGSIAASPTTLLSGNFIGSFSDLSVVRACGVSESEIKVSMHSCTDKEFNCADGECVDIRYICDGVGHCRDHSDENGCSVVKQSEAYSNRFGPPISEHQERMQGNPHSPVNVTIRLMSIMDIIESSSEFIVKLFLKQEWYDMRLEFYDLKTDDLLNTLPQEDVDYIWYPKSIFLNTQSDSHQEDKKTLGGMPIRVIRSEGADEHITEMEIPSNRLVFQGKDNKLSLQRVMSIRYICEYEMKNYPFDVQDCYMNITMEEQDLAAARLKAHVLEYLGPVSLSQYTVKKMDMCEVIFDNCAGVRVKIQLGRELSSFGLTVLFPTMILNIIVFVTHYLRESNFELSIATNLTVMLVLATMFVSVSDALPKTQDPKMVEIWLIVSLIVPFVEVLAQSFIEVLTLESRKPRDEVKQDEDPGQIKKIFRKQEKKIFPIDDLDAPKKDKRKLMLKIAKKVDFITQILPPFLYLVAFTAGYFIYGFHLQNEALKPDSSLRENCVEAKLN